MTPRRTVVGRRLTRVAALPCAVAITAVLATSMVGCTAQDHATPADTYGGMPSYLATIPSDTDEVLTGTTKHPALTSEGDTVRTHLADGTTLLATVTGPVVPGEGLPHQGETTTCTWTVTLRHSSRDVTVDIGDLTTVDQLGNAYTLVPVPGRSQPPAVLHPGQRSTFELRTVMKVGEGVLRWSPGGAGTLAEWDFEVEND